MKGPVLNAFRHQRSRQVTDQLQGREVKYVLNAFRHQRSRQQRAHKLPSGSENKCSTPFGIKDQDRDFGSTEKAAKGRCSTPFGIKDQDRNVKGMTITDMAECSTPFGIKDQDSRWMAERPVWPGGAQRLSASKIKTATATMTYVRTIRCSTPFGIKDQDRPRPPNSWGWWTLCAQRLSASKIKTGT